MDSGLSDDKTTKSASRQAKWDVYLTSNNFVSQDLNFAPAGKDENPHQLPSPENRHTPLFPSTRKLWGRGKEKKSTEYKTLESDDQSWLDFNLWDPDAPTLINLRSLKRRKVCLLVLAALLVIVVGLATIFGVRANRGKGGGEQQAVAAEGTASVTVGSTVYDFNEDVQVDVATSDPKSTYYVGLFEQDKKPGQVYTISDTKPAMWYQLCNENRACEKHVTLTFNRRTEWMTEYSIDWPLCNGQWVACLINQATLINMGCSDQFEVKGGNCDSVCKSAIAGFTPLKHLNPTPMSPVSKIAFGSGFDQASQVDGTMWEHVRNVFQPDLWVWLGDIIDAEGEDMESKRLAYNNVKDDQFYKGVGPLAEPQIPVTGTW
jgi:hypothetical protein